MQALYFMQKLRIISPTSRPSLFVKAMISPLDLVFDPTLALTRFAEDLHLNYAMITAGYLTIAAYVDPFARSWPGLSTTNMVRPKPYYFTTSAPDAKDIKSIRAAPHSRSTLAHSSIVAPVV